jgi:hypothetical protein
LLKFGKTYNSIDELPIWNFSQINKSGDLGYLYFKYKKPKDKRLLKIWENIYDEFIKRFGLSENYIKYINIRQQALELYKEAYVDGEKYKRVLADIKVAEAERLIEDSEDVDLFEVSAYLTKNNFGRIDVKVVSVAEFYSYLKIIKKENGKKN